MDISASMIKDILSCSMKGYYRSIRDYSSYTTTPLQTGSIVHEILEKKWMNYNQAILEAGNKCIGLDEDIYKKVCEYITVFFENFYQLLSPEDEIEKNFSINIDGKNKLVGKIDRVNKDSGLLFDWKTTNSVPQNIDNDIQFIIYNYAFRKMYGKLPVMVALASLKSGKLIKFHYNGNYEYMLFNSIIPKVISVMNKKEFYMEGVFSHDLAKMSNVSRTCANCPYKKVCWNEE